MMLTPEEIESFGGAFAVALIEEMDKLPYTPGLDDGGYNDGFENGAEWALKYLKEHPELLNE